MNIKTYTKRDIASEVAKRKGISTRKALSYIDEFFIPACFKFSLANLDVVKK